MDISRILKGGKAPKPEEGKPPPPAGEKPQEPPPAAPPPAAVPPAARGPGEVKGESLAEIFSRPGARYQIHRDVPTLEDMDQARALYAELVRATRSFLPLFLKQRKLSAELVEPFRLLFARMLPLLKSSPNAFLIYFPRGTADDYLIGKLANVGLLSARLGLQMGMPEADALGLMLGAFFHDIGLASINRLDLEPRILPDEGRSYLRRHCEESLPFILADLPEKKFLLDICLYHHERLDGSGYPKGLRAEAIPAAARVVAVAEMYEALSHSRPYRDRHLPTEAMKTVIDEGGRLFHEAVVKALIRSLSIYPPGSYVELNNMTIARVVGVNPDLPTRPLLLPVFDGSGRSLPDGNFRDLSATPLVRIQRAVDETSLQIGDAIEQLALRSQRWWTA